MSAMDSITRPLEEIERDSLEYHPKVKARLAEEMERAQAKLETVKPEELADAQAWMKALRMMLKLPQTIFEEEVKRLEEKK